MRFSWLIIILLILGGCSQANVRGNETVREYNITVNNSDGSTLTMTMPLSVDAIVTESLEQTTDNDPATDTDLPVSLAAQGATASTSGSESTQEITKPVSDYRPVVTPAPVVVPPVVVTPPAVPLPVPPEEVKPPVDPEEPPVVDPEDPVAPVDPPSPIQPGIPTVTEWLHTDVSDWEVTADLQSVSTTSSSISLPYDKAKVWPSVTKGSGTIVNANPWVMVEQGGKWYAATWEWLRPGQTTKKKSSVAGDHIKKSPLKNWKPKVGETLYFMVSGLARDSTRNVEERSQWVKFIWK